MNQLYNVVIPICYYHQGHLMNLYKLPILFSRSIELKSLAIGPGNVHFNKYLGDSNAYLGMGITEYFIPWMT